MIRKTPEAAVEVLKRYYLKLEDSETPVPTYNQLAEDYRINPEFPNYKNWKIPYHVFINNVIFDMNFDDKFMHKKFNTNFMK